jgi:predicted PhzF superfamily epimerase YddE/YHI9
MLRGARPAWCGCNSIDLFAELESDAAVRAFAPDLDALARIPMDGLIVTAPAGDGVHDVVSRYFAPRCGIPEDPATGAAHCAIAPYWQERLGGRLRCLQASPRNAVLETEVAGDRVRVGGAAVTIVRGSVIV